MAHVFRQTYTKTLPSGERVTRQTRKWYVEYLDADGIRRRVPGYTDRAATDQLGARLEREAAQVAAGLLPREALQKQHARPLGEHLAEYRRALEAKADDPRYIHEQIARVRAALVGCGFIMPADLLPDRRPAARVMGWLASLRADAAGAPELPADRDEFTPAEVARLLGLTSDGLRAAVQRHGLAATGKGKRRRLPRATVEFLLERRRRGRSVATSNHYLTALKGFSRWLSRERRLPSDPFAELAKGNADVDRRHDRRELTADELRRLLEAARSSARSFRGLTGPDRYALYVAACATGFRAAALASLTPEAFTFDGDFPTITLAARFNKSRKPKVQPLPPDAAAVLREYLRERPAGRPVWGGTWATGRRGAVMIRRDLEAVGIPYSVEGPDGPLYADFHALRHSYITALGRGGVDLRTAQELAGHSTPLLTARYSHRRLYDLAGAVEKLPDFIPAAGGPESQTAALRATGTEGRPAEKLGVRLGVNHPKPVHSPATSCKGKGIPEAGAETTQPAATAAGCRELHPFAARVDEGIRTPDTQIHSLVL